MGLSTIPLDPLVPQVVSKLIRVEWQTNRTGPAGGSREALCFMGASAFLLGVSHQVRPDTPCMQYIPTLGWFDGPGVGFPYILARVIVTGNLRKSCFWCNDRIRMNASNDSTFDAYGPA